MEIIGCLFLNPNFSVHNAELRSTVTRSPSGAMIRLYCKERSVDENVLVFFDELPEQTDVPFLQRQFKREVENYRFMGFLNQRRILLKLRKYFTTESETDITLPQGQHALVIPFDYDAEGLVFAGRLIVTARILQSLMSLFKLKPTGDMEDDIHRLRKSVFQKASVPPKNFAQLLLTLTDEELQKVLNAFLHKNIASTDMLATYFLSFGNDMARMLGNVSANVRAELLRKLSEDRMSASSRWKTEVDFIINRNIFISLGELDLSIPNLAVLEHVKRGYEVFVIQEQMRHKPVGEWLSDFKGRVLISELINRIKRQRLIAGLSFAENAEIESVFKDDISQNGLRLLIEDVDTARRFSPEQRYPELIRFFYEVKEIHYAPLLKNYDFAETVRERIPNYTAVELVVDEIGFAPAVFALKALPRKWNEDILRGAFRYIYEDLSRGYIHVKDWDDYRTDEAKRRFLTALLILSDEEKI